MLWTQVVLAQVSQPCVLSPVSVSVDMSTV